MTQILVEVPDELVRAILALPKSERPEGDLAESITHFVRRGLANKAKAMLDEGAQVDLLYSLMQRIKALAVGHKFTLNDLTDDLQLHPNTKKMLGRKLAQAANEATLFRNVGKTAQNLITYERI